MKAALDFSILLVLGLLVGCGTPHEGADDEADIAAIKSLSKQAQAAYIARDWEGFASFFTDDGVWMPSGKLPLIGKEAWWSWIGGGWDRGTIDKMDLSHDEIVVAGDWAFERHSESTVSTRGGETRERHYKGVWILRRQADGSWKIARYIWNRNPAPADS